jgi:DNA ligase-1
MSNEPDVDSWDGTGTLPTLYAKTATGAIQVWICWVEGGDVCTQYGQKDGAMQDARFACTPKNVGRTNATDVRQQAIAEAISKWKKQCKKKGYYAQEEQAATTLRLAPMLAKKYGDIKGRIPWPVDGQPKLNGVRCLAYRTEEGGPILLQSRGGDAYSVAHVSEALSKLLQPGITLDGELYAHGTSLQQILSLCRRPQPDSLLLTYNVYDMAWLHGIERAAPWTQRKYLLQTWLAKHTHAWGPICGVETFEVTDEESLKAHHARLVARGFEGVILRMPEGIYNFGKRSSDLLKYKLYQDAEFPIVGWTTGKGKFAGVPIFVCKAPNGKTFEAVMNGTMEERAQILANAANLIGQQLTVSYFELSDDNTPMQPTGIAIRPPGT